MRELPRGQEVSFPLTHRLERMAWMLLWGVLGSWTPAPLHAWRRFLVRVFGGNIAPTARIYGGVRIWYPKNLEMGDFACLGPEVDCYCMAKVSVGANAIVSQRAVLCAGTHDIADSSFPLITKPIVIGPGAWIAAEAFVGPGVHVGEGAVLGARGTAFRDLEPWTVYSGNPATALKVRSIRSQRILDDALDTQPQTTKGFGRHHD